MREIREWLEKGAPYAAGVALYETHGKSRVVLKSLCYGETAFTRATLRRELEKLLVPGPAEKVASASEKVASSPRNVVSSPEKVASPPTAGTRPALDEQRRTWYATRAYTHAQLELAATDAARAELAGRILASSADIDASYRPLAEASLPEAQRPTDAGEQRRQLANLRSQASKLKRRPARAGELARVLTQIREVETVLKNPRDGEPQLHPRH